MKTLLIATNTESIPDPVFPLGTAYIADSLKKNNMNFQILDLFFCDDFKSKIKSKILEYKPDIIGLSLRNFDSTTYPNFLSYIPFYQEIVDTIKKQTSSIIVLGGAAFSIMPEVMLKYLKADIGIVGEGEYEFINFIKKIEQNPDYLSTIDKKIIDANLINIKENNTTPDRDAFEFKKYYKLGGMANIQTKRGCPFKCIYCTYPIVEGRKVRLRNHKNVCDEIEGILEKGVNTLFFVDNEFLFPIEHPGLICKEIINRNLSVKWGCFGNPGILTNELAELMAKAGCTSIDFGSDSANDKMLLNMGKDFTVKDLFKASAICKENSINFCHSLLLGGPGETFDTIKDSLDNILEISPTAAACMIGIRIYPNTKLFNIAISEGVISSDNDLLEPTFYLSKYIKDEIIEYMEDFSSKNKNWIFLGLKNSMSKKIQKGLRKIGYKGPLWQHMKKFR